MNERMNIQSKTNWAIATVVAIAIIGIAAPLAFADNIGAPTSAAGGLSAPSSPSLSPAAGPLGSSGSSMHGGSLNGSSSSYDYEPLKLQQPGTGKFEGPHNGTTTPCIGSTGFGSSGGIPGHKC
jgi:hypothetical protein